MIRLSTGIDLPNPFEGRALTRKAQSTLEYAVLIAIVAAACATMTTYVYRAVRANMKTIERQINVEPD